MGSMMAIRSRSLSSPARFIIRTAIDLPSGENVGPKSYAGFSAVMSTGLVRPSLATRNASVAVRHAFSRPATRATNATVLPSGATLTSSMPPNGWVGESVS